ncbi:MAG: hypothetical protein VXW49_05100 [Pseudomonadota bacterium]|nr:hypothetical protein [Pseudomonadota bacterium]
MSFSQLVSNAIHFGLSENSDPKQDHLPVRATLGNMNWAREGAQ